MPTRLELPGRIAARTLNEQPSWPRTHPPPRSRRVFAAAHVAARASAGGDVEIDWAATLGFRHHLWSMGFGVAEAMDTAQRGAGLDWPAAEELIRRSSAEATSRGAVIACGAGTDDLVADAVYDLAEIVAAYERQAAVIEDAGAQVVVLASRALARSAAAADDYAQVYDRVLRQLRRPGILHWLGPMFDPALDGYWGSRDPGEATETVLQIVTEHAARIDGIKVSLLDRDREIALRSRLPSGVRLYTGDDFNYPGLIRGDDCGHSDALLGVLAAVAEPAAAALAALDRDDLSEYDRVMARTVPLARHIFCEPTYDYKTGIAFLAWLNGHQDEFTMLAGGHRKRGTEHLVRLFELADDAYALTDPQLAVTRLQSYLSAAGATT